MKIKSIAAGLFFGALSLLLAADNPAVAVPKFDGYLASGAGEWFLLALPGSHDNPGNQAWLKIGQTIGDFKVARFYAAREVLVLERADGKVVEISLADSQLIEESESERLLQQTIAQLQHPSTRGVGDFPYADRQNESRPSAGR